MLGRLSGNCCWWFTTGYSNFEVNFLLFSFIFWVFFSVHNLFCFRSLLFNENSLSACHGKLHFWNFRVSTKWSLSFAVELLLFIPTTDNKKPFYFIFCVRSCRLPEVVLASACIACCVCIRRIRTHDKWLRASERTVWHKSHVYIGIYESFDFLIPWLLLLLLLLFLVCFWPKHH